MPVKSDTLLAVAKHAGVVLLVLIWSFFCWNRGFNAGSDVMECTISHLELKNGLDEFCDRADAADRTPMFWVQKHLPDAWK